MNTEYERWNSAMVDRYFSPEKSGKLAYLAVDDDEVASLAREFGEDPAAGAALLSAAVRRELTSSPTYGLYERFLKARSAWRRHGAEGPPPYVALLGLAVLAASRMARDENAGIAAHNYYRRYNPLIGGEGRSCPPGFEGQVGLWCDLELWLDRDLDGSRGHSTVRTGYFEYIGYPISQCLLRERDRRRLTEFFRAVGLAPGEEITAGELGALFVAWSHPGCGLSGPAIRVIESGSQAVRDQLTDILYSEYEQWEGEWRRPDGRVAGEIVLALSLREGARRASLAFFAQQPDGFPEGRFPAAGGREVELASLGGGWYGQLAIPVDRSALEDGVEIDLGDRSLAYRPAPVIVLQASTELPQWAAVRQARPAEDCCVIFSARLEDDVRRFLRHAAEPEWMEVRDATGLPLGWKLATRVIISRPVSPPLPELRCLASRFGRRSRLEGGLPLAPRIYLSSAEPDLWVAAEPGEKTTVSVDGEEELIEGSARVRLSERRLAEGTHFVVAGEANHRFSTSAGHPVIAASGTGSLGYRFQRSRDYLPESPVASELLEGEQRVGWVEVCGSRARTPRAEDLPEQVAPPALLPFGYRNYTVIGRLPGEILTGISPPERPSWLGRAGLGASVQFFDHPVPFSVQWLIAEDRRGAIAIRALRNPPEPPAPVRDGLGAGAARSWAEAITSAGSARPVRHAGRWDEYAEAASLA